MQARRMKPVNRSLSKNKPAKIRSRIRRPQTDKRRPTPKPVKARRRQRKRLSIKRRRTHSRNCWVKRIKSNGSVYVIFFLFVSCLVKPQKCILTVPVEFHPSKPITKYIYLVLFLNVFRLHYSARIRNRGVSEESWNSLSRSIQKAVEIRRRLPGAPKESKKSFVQNELNVS